MRVVKETTVDGIRVSVFDWNNKYLIKFEEGMVEQTFKVNATDITSESDLDALLEGEFLNKIKERSHEMHKSLQNGLKNL